MTVIETYHLHLEMNHELTFYVFLIFIDLVFIYKLDKFEYTLSLDSTNLNMFYDLIKNIFLILYDTLYRVNLNPKFKKIWQLYNWML